MRALKQNDVGPIRRFAPMIRHFNLPMTYRNVCERRAAKVRSGCTRLTCDLSDMKGTMVATIDRLSSRL